MLKNMSLQTRLISGFVLVGILVLIVGLIGVFGTARLSGNINNLGNNVIPSLVGLWTANEAQSRELAAEKSLIISSLTAEQRKEQLKRLDEAVKDIDKGIAQYDKAYRYPEEQKIYDRVKNELNNWKQAREEFLNLHDQYLKAGITNARQAMLDLALQGKTNTPEFAAAKVAADALSLMNQFGDSKLEPASDAITNALGELLEYNTKVGDDATKQAFQDAASSSLFILICLFVGPIIAVMFGIYFSNTIVKPLGAKIAGVVGVAEKVSSGDLTTQVPVSEERDEVGRLTLAFRGMTDNLNSLIRQVQQSGIQITTSATQIAASGKELEATMTEQAASTNRVATTAKTIVNTSKKLLKTIDEVENTSKETADSASDSQKDLSQMETTMRKLAEATSSISGRLGVISDKANNINSIVTTITKVADQTNLLSLNAAIEAEKAGEYGSGFAVVAREIRRLADQTAVASLDIENMVKEMQAAVSLGVMEMDKFTNEVEQGVNKVHEIGIKLESIIDQVQTLTPRFQEVGNSMEGQSQEAEQISESMIQLSEASAQTAQSLREINGAISQLNDAAQNLRQEISRFKIAKS